MTVSHGATGNVGTRDQGAAERVSELIQEHWHALFELRLGGRWNRPRGDLRPAPLDDFLAVVGNEFVEHWTLPNERSISGHSTVGMFQIAHGLLRHVSDRCASRSVAAGWSLVHAGRGCPVVNTAHQRLGLGLSESVHAGRHEPIRRSQPDSWRRAMLHSPVLVGTNLTPGAEGALRQAAGLARDLGGRLIVCHVMPELLRIGMLFPQWRGVDPRLVEAMTTKARDAVSRELESILGDQPLSTEIVLDSGTP